MLIKEMKINGVKEPIGYLTEYLTATFKITDTKSHKADICRLEVAQDENFDDIIFTEDNASPIGTAINIELKPRSRYFFRAYVKGDMGDEATGMSFFETGKMEDEWVADWITAGKGDLHPILRKTFTTEKDVKRARLYICGVGLFEAYLNGEKVGDEYLTPYVTNYEKGIQIITFPVENYLQGGRENALEIYLAKGWYMGTFGLEGTKENFGNQMAAIAELHIEYETGSELIKTDGSWEYRGSDFEDTGIYDGEVLNRTLWDGKENEWKSVSVISEPQDDKGTANLVKKNLRDRLSIPVVVREEINAKEVIATPAGESVVDFGQNFAGFVEFKADFPKGTRIVLNFGEILQKGNFYNDNYREAKSEYVYVSGGEKETVRAHFTFFGFRYMKVSGWPGEISTKDFTGKVLCSDVERTGFIETGNAKINRLYENTLWGLYSNFIDMPTDCPQRNERLGWTGDAQVFSATATYHTDTLAFFRKFNKDLRDEQELIDGAIPNYVPNIGHKKDAGPIWGDVGTIEPWNLYNAYGDKEFLRSAYPMMKDWVDYIDREDAKRGERKYINDFSFTFGDWLALDGATETSFKGSTEDAYLSTVYDYRSAVIVADAAKILGYEQDEMKYRAHAEKIREAILNEYFTPNGRLAMDSQTGILVALKFGICKDREKLISQLKARFKKDMYKIKGGFVGATMMCTVLGENDMSDIAYDFLFNESFPGWLYEVNLGATTIWERWNSVLEDGTISPTGMNSLNHYSYGSVEEFMYAYAAGIRPKTAGYREIIIDPHPDVRLKFLNASYNSVRGKIVCEWKIRDDGDISLHVEIPFGTHATLHLPGNSSEPVKELESGVYDITYTPDRDYRKPFGWDCRLSRLAGNADAKNILKKYVPPLAGMMHDPETACNTFRELSHMGFLPIDPEGLKKAVAELEEVTAL
ncbi:family 78 glycoside hydrolase catalytic domain [Butyrivibrio sp. AE3006]|uniref:family 78 glycoside hydrolase catalytic domain n=1 Tax=Butyrivibrio sp. AE3006 TaxID=1280673 RepID=UPI00040FE279|nr:family 78 glycoside hydrolase catalytic domain [Butyrivibrio sp. AE3006]